MTIQELIDFSRERGGLETDDVLAALLPLFRQVADCHEHGLVAPLRGIEALKADDQFRVGFDPDLATQPERNDAQVEAIERTAPRALEVVGRSETKEDVLAGRYEAHSLDVLKADEEVTRPVFVPGWETWEHRIGHHDQLTDIASLGELLAAIAGGLDLALNDDAERLARARGNLFSIASALHPVVAQTAAKMLDPDRHRRLQDLRSIIQRLETYRDQPLDLDLPTLAASARPTDRRRVILTALRDRLFDLSRRNKLIYFRATQQSLNLTESSVPLLLDSRNIRPEQLFTWSEEHARLVLSGRPLSLSSLIRWEDAPYATSILDGLISQARRDRSEYGMVQLRLVVAFLRWHDLKNEPAERISSPLLLLPVELTKKRGVRDSYVLQALSTEAEVNPALRQHLRQLYALELPSTLDLTRTSVAEFHAQLAAAISRTEPAVTLAVQDKPRIELVHRRALIRLEAFQRRVGRGSAMIARRAYSYSYRRRDYRPLGIQIFRDRVAHRPSPLGVVLGDGPAMRIPAFAAPVVKREQETYVLDTSGTGNPYAWDLDLCAVTLANFNYRTMSLVRDYGELIDSGRTSSAFDRVFSVEPRPIDHFDRRPLPLRDRNLVVSADGSQVAAIARARTGESFVIQGPPGTGKSQTITNLIADYVAAGKRVLFVCQKRAAIDIVHSRLRQRGLDELTCLIHDSQEDKKAFVQGLRATYEAWLNDGSAIHLQDAEARRARILFGVGNALQALEQYEAALTTAPGGGPTLREMVERLVDLRDQRWGEALAPELRRHLPTAPQWWKAREIAISLAGTHESFGRSGVLADSPTRFISPRLLVEPQPDAELAYRAPALARQVRDVVARLDDLARGFGRPLAVEPGQMGVASVTALAGLGSLMAPLAARRASGVLRPATIEDGALRRNVQMWQGLLAVDESGWRQASGWHHPLDPNDTEAALAIALANETSILRFLNGSWRRVNSAVHQRFASPGRVVPMTVTEALQRLSAAHRSRATLVAAAQASLAGWGYDDPNALLKQIEAVRSSADPAVCEWREVLADTSNPSVAGCLAALAPDIAQLRSGLASLLADVDDLPLDALAALLDSLVDRSVGSLIRASAPLLVDLASHPEVAWAVRWLPARVEQIEYAVLAAALNDAAARSAEISRFDGRRLAGLIEEVERLLPQLYEANAATIVARTRQVFTRQVAHSERSVSGMTPQERQQKKTWVTGRRELENEFRKVMRFRAIRELASDEPGAVVATLRPIWLMSPTSVSDTLPLDPSRFDVVIYDEASQIPVEEAVPAMHRSNQVIVVGDQMQLPPTQFFTARTEPGDDTASEDDEDLEIGVVLDSDSFLGQSAGRLASTMLTWHYRSRSEALIAFSNAAFYEGRLATIPDRTPPPPTRTKIVVDVGGANAIDSDATRVGVEALLARPISFHRLTGSVYHRRTNLAEAAYIAQLVRELLGRQAGLTIGIVAFSEAQQAEIERALERLADTDDDFGKLYEAELAREEDGQLVGLFVKNLENVQGDERDVIIMSVCYGPDADGHMIMNFGPINQEGGEKRLNVIFSRSRVHMAIVSSIDDDAITNTFNDGANTLRRFLRYAAMASTGDDRAQQVLVSFGGDGLARTAEESPACTVGAQVAAALRARDLEVVARVGQSAFRADLAVRRPSDPEYRLAVLIDGTARIEAEPAIERLLSHPAAFRNAGWRVAHVLIKDWFDDPEQVIDALVSAVERPDDPTPAPPRGQGSAPEPLSDPADSSAVSDEPTASEERKPGIAPEPSNTEHQDRRFLVEAATAAWTIPIRDYIGQVTITQDLGVYISSGRMRRLDLATGRELANFRSRIGVYKFVIVPSTGSVFVTGSKRIVHLDELTLTERGRVEDGIPDITEIAYQDGRVIVSHGWGQTASLVNMSTGEVQRKRIGENSILIGTPGRTLVVGGKVGGVSAIDATTATSRRLFEAPAAVDAAISPDGASLWLLPGDRSAFAGDGSRLGQPTTDLRIYSLAGNRPVETIALQSPVNRVCVGRRQVWLAGPNDLFSFPVEDPGSAVSSWHAPKGQSILAFDPNVGCIITALKPANSWRPEEMTCFRTPPEP